MVIKIYSGNCIHVLKPANTTQFDESLKDEIAPTITNGNYDKVEIIKPKTNATHTR